MNKTLSQQTTHKLTTCQLITTYMSAVWPSQHELLTLAAAAQTKNQEYRPVSVFITTYNTLSQFKVHYTVHLQPNPRGAPSVQPGLPIATYLQATPSSTLIYSLYLPPQYSTSIQYHFVNSNVNNSNTHHNSNWLHSNMWMSCHYNIVSHNIINQQLLDFLKHIKSS